MKQAKHVYMLL